MQYFNFNMICALFFIQLLFFVNSISAQNCNALLQRTDNCVKKILYIGDDDLKIIRTEADLDDHCREIKSAFRCMLRYQKCLKGLPKQVFGLFARSAKQIIKDRCDTEEGKKEFLRHSQCVQKPDIYLVNKCVHKSDLVLKFIDRNATSEEVAPALCCSIFMTAKCLKDTTDKYCLTRTGNETGKYIADISIQFSQNMIDFGCGQVTNLKECQEDEPFWYETFTNLGNPLESVPSKKSAAMVRNMMRLSRHFIDE